ncbi:MAG: ABC transporter ATP-binding protein [Candidatus Binatia bacterium]
MIRLMSVSKRYDLDGVGVQALDDVTCHIPAGQFAAIVGPSGSGKSTLLHILGLLDTRFEGRYLLDGRPVSGLSEDQLAALRSGEMGFVFQAFNLLPQLTILENVALPALYAGDRSPAVCRAAARARLEQLGLSDRLAHRPAQLSAGQRQRVAIARAIVNSPRLLLADEPTGALDSRTAQEILGILRGLHREGMTVVVVTHNPRVAAAAQRVIDVLDGAIRDAA